MPTPEPLLPVDEELHTAGADPHWQESYYFNWADLEGTAFGLARVGIRVNEGRGDGVVVMFRDGRRELVYGGLGKKVTPDPRAETGLTVGRLTMTMDEPLQRWRIKLDGTDTIDLTWTALAPPFDFDESGGADVLAARHFEHPGRVVGTTRIDGREHTVNGFGTRDKSWGPRDWGNITGWDWISAQFGPDLAFTAMQSLGNGPADQSGFVYDNGTCTAIDHFTAHFDWASPDLVRKLTLTITDQVGREYRVTGTPIVGAPLFKSGMVIQETHARFEATVDGRTRVGAGIIEHTFHGSPSTMMRWAPRLLPVAKDVLKSSRR
ncbi:MAG: hypothetical protein QM728_00525 [Gordonia sp. (in: high G+C Gram-positive bacteria)]|uniref:DUF7064 domain-containing protein n=1 Tax=Gordonia sp. (in: high G+C Gram-positive bacteria) TaxID=84139 RepID=UPI0039E545C9